MPHRAAEGADDGFGDEGEHAAMAGEDVERGCHAGFDIGGLDAVRGGDGVDLDLGAVVDLAAAVAALFGQGVGAQVGELATQAAVDAVVKRVQPHSDGHADLQLADVGGVDFGFDDIAAGGG